MTWLVCEQCGGRYINRGGHLEECPGPRQIVAPPPPPELDSCTCPAGFQHQLGCHLAHWPAALSTRRDTAA